MKRSLTNSMIKIFNTCQQKYKLQYIDLLTPKMFYMPFAVGGAIHDATAKLFKTKNVEKAVHTGTQYLEKTKKSYELEKVFSEEEDQAYIYQLSCIEAIVRNYAAFYADFVRNVRVIASEEILESSMKLPGGFTLTTKPDAVLRHNDKTILYEQKTARVLSKDYAMIHLPQILTYYSPANDKYNIDEVRIDIIKKPSITQRKEESIEEFLTRLSEWYLLPEQFYLEEFVVRPKHLKQHLSLIYSTAQNIVRAENENNFPCNRYSCRIFRACEYLLLCNHGMNPMTLMKYRKKEIINEELSEMEV